MNTVQILIEKNGVQKKLEMVDPTDNTSFTNLKNDTPDTWHLNWPDMWHMGGGVNILLKFQLSSFFGLGVMMFQGFEEKVDSINEIINHKGVCRTAPATPCLLNITSPMWSVQYLV